MRAACVLMVCCRQTQLFLNGKTFKPTIVVLVCQVSELVAEMVKPTPLHHRR